MTNNILSILLVTVILGATAFIFIRIALRIRKHGGSMTTTVVGSTYEFLGEDKREAAEEIIERKADKNRTKICLEMITI